MIYLLYLVIELFLINLRMPCACHCCGGAGSSGGGGGAGGTSVGGGGGGGDVDLRGKSGGTSKLPSRLSTNVFHSSNSWNVDYLGLFGDISWSGWSSEATFLASLVAVVVKVLVGLSKLSFNESASIAFLTEALCR